MSTTGPLHVQISYNARPGAREASYWRGLALAGLLVTFIVFLLPLEWFWEHWFRREFEGGRAPILELELDPAIRLLDLPAPAPTAPPARSRVEPLRATPDAVLEPKPEVGAVEGLDWSWDPSTPYAVRQELLRAAEPPPELEELLQQIETLFAARNLTTPAPLDSAWVQVVRQNFRELQHQIFRAQAAGWDVEAYNRRLNEHFEYLSTLGQ